MKAAIPALILLFVIPGMLARPEAAVAGRPLLAVRTYHVVPISPQDWNAVVSVASGILNRAGIDVDWVDCVPEDASRPDTVPSRCLMPSRNNEVVLRVVRRATIGSSGHRALGDSLLDASTHSGTLATVYLEEIEHLAQEAGVSSQTVMARAIAHELGHLLLGTGAHSTYGLMRRVWTADELVRNRPVDWTFAPRDSVQMRLAFNRRLDLQPAMNTRGDSDTPATMAGRVERGVIGAE
jgi:hypothetical protein